MPDPNSPVTRGRALLLTSIAIFAITFVGCQSDASNTPATSAPIAPPVEEVALTEVWRSGDDSSDDSIILSGRVGTISVSSTGTVIVPDVQSDHVLVYDRDGKLKTTAGRSGEGPGELKFPKQSFVGAGDSVYVYDGQLNRLSVFGPDTYEFVRSVEFPLTGSLKPRDLITVIDGRAMAFYTAINVGGTNEETLDSQVRWVGGGPDSLLHSTKADQQVVAKIGTTTLIFPGPLARVSACTASTEFLYCGWSDRPQFTRKSLATNGLAEFTFDYEPVRISSAMRDSIETMWRENADPPMADAVMSAGIPETKPAFIRLLVDDEERVWLEIDDADETTHQWWILDVENMQYRKTIIPKSYVLHAVRDGFVYAIDHSDAGLAVVKLSIES